MFGDCKDDEQLRDTWHRFCDELREAGELIFRDTTPANPVTRATGLRLLARNISLGLQFELENNDPRVPHLMHYFDPVRKQGGDNADALYQGAPINGTDTYRISGNRGTAAFFAVTVLENGETPWGGAVVGTLLGDDLEVDEHGDFELYLGPEPQPGNWIKTSPDSYRVTFRQFFNDWENERRMEARIERLGPPAVPEDFTPERARAGLLGAARWVAWSTHFWADKIDLWKARRNEFVSYGELEDKKIDFTPAGTPLIAYWRVPRDEALLIRVTPPKDCTYWNCEFGNYWWETMDYRQRITSINGHYAHYEEDGSLLVIISHEDPGVGNWMDPSGHEDGYITFRWMGTAEVARPVCEQVPISGINALDGGNTRVSVQSRRKGLQQRTCGVPRRFYPL
ncbi:DUF1214 domain-containing protein [Parahaliea mediterranea]|uniref:DUF1214 domain-containing protein n=1 Tax=Parahaliea mediterranea TaxID=651086 RepID=A0A939DD71_9GAMM|nr:DUF1214 domain-containing protein [Parahaliea mediterranea]MBN7795919.1 DUF1214 domain-containing protein [Parahaliea mediterranea]